VRASLGRSEGEQEESNGLITRFESRDYLIDVADLLLDDLASEPQVGDRIIEGPVGRRQGLPGRPDPRPPCWEYADAYRNKFRVHTKFVGNQPPEPE
jgi:hypothetical protein